jgi:hypothetical protein
MFLLLEIYYYEINVKWMLLIRLFWLNNSCYLFERRATEKRIINKWDNAFLSKFIKLPFLNKKLLKYKLNHLLLDISYLNNIILT